MRGSRSRYLPGQRRGNAHIGPGRVELVARTGSMGAEYTLDSCACSPNTGPRLEASPPGQYRATPLSSAQPSRSISTRRRNAASPRSARSSTCCSFLGHCKSRTKTSGPCPGLSMNAASNRTGTSNSAPSEPFDISLADRVLAAAMEHTDHVDIVVLPESSVPEDQLASLETVLARHGVSLLIAGLEGSGTGPPPILELGALRRTARRAVVALPARQASPVVARSEPNRAVPPRCGARPASAVVGGARTPPAVPLFQLIERGDGYTIASLVCEDLAHIDEVIDAIRLVGPTLLVALLLDGPQLSSRWAARYASVWWTTQGRRYSPSLRTGWFARARLPNIRRHLLSRSGKTAAAARMRSHSTLTRTPSC